MFVFISLLLSVCLTKATHIYTVNANVTIPPSNYVKGLDPKYSKGCNCTLGMRTTHLELNGKPYFPFAGEIHPGRVPRASWRRDLSLMKSGGIKIVDAYVFWNHVQELGPTSYNWTGSNDIRAFVLEAQALGLLVHLRIGPWDHGEARYGGIPDWVQMSGYPVRQNNTGFMNLTKYWYCGLGSQLQGLGWGDGGVIMGIQVDNESDDIDYLLALRSLAIQCGLNPFMFTRTGWPPANAPVPEGSLVPYFGGYTDLFWTAQAGTIPSSTFLFTAGNSLATGYPFLLIEEGGGMTSAYHRRVRVAPRDIVAAAHVFLGSGASQIGFYMYHGGYNPMGVKSTFQESQLVGGWDLPIRTYDFYAPIGQNGQPHQQYHALRMLSMTVSQLQGWLAPSPEFIPQNSTPSGVNDTTTLRWGLRSDGQSGLLVVSNFQNFMQMRTHNNVRFEVVFRNKKLLIPHSAKTPFTISGGFYGTIPLMIQLPPIYLGLTLEYATAQLLYSTTVNQTIYTMIFHVTSGSDRNEFVFAFDNTISNVTVTQCVGACSATHDRAFGNLLPSFQIALQLTVTDLRTKNVATVNVILVDLSESNSQMWLNADRDCAHITSSGLTWIHSNSTGATVEALRSNGNFQMYVFSYPPSRCAFAGDTTTFGAFGFTSKTLKPSPLIQVVTTKLQDAGPPPAIHKGPSGVAQAPSADGSLGAFAQAEVHEISLQLPKGTDFENTDTQLLISFSGDVARIYRGNSTEREDLLFDHFYDDRVFSFPWSRIGLKGNDTVTLRVLPLQETSLIYFERPPPYNSSKVALGLNSVKVVQYKQHGFQYK